MDAFRKERLKDSFRDRHLLFFFLSVILYMVFNLYINQVYLTGTTIFGLNKIFLGFFALFYLLIAFLVGLNINLIILRFKEMQAVEKKGGLTLLGVLGGLIGGGCPGCFVGLFPAVAGIFGANLTLNSLPFYGLEIQAASAIILLVSVYLLTKPMTCKVKT